MLVMLFELKLCISFQTLYFFKEKITTNNFHIDEARKGHDKFNVENNLNVEFYHRQRNLILAKIDECFEKLLIYMKITMQ